LFEGVKFKEKKAYDVCDFVQPIMVVVGPFGGHIKELVLLKGWNQCELNVVKRAQKLEVPGLFGAERARQAENPLVALIILCFFGFFCC
jgi:hypothetical protein